jgi:hypothetical protein
MKVKITGGWAKGKTGVLIKEYTEKAFGIEWNCVDIEIIVRRKKKVVSLPAACYEVIE